MYCPKCNSMVPEGAKSCDCGFDLTAAQTQKPKTSLVLAGWVLSLLGGLFGLLVAWYIAFGRSKPGSGYLFDEPSRKMGKVMFFVAVVMTIVCKFAFIQ